MYIIDSGTQSSLVNSAVISKPIYINMSKCKSLDSYNIKGMISLDLSFNTLAGNEI